MVTIRLHNSLTRKKEEFHPLDPKNVRMYVCGPTVYDRAHLGNARPVVVFDTLYRLLRHVYGEGHVTYVRNFTDVDDKINAEAQRRKAAGRAESLEDLIRERTEETIGWYHADMDAIGALRPDHEPRATDYIGEMIAMTERLIEGGHAYAAEGHVLFRVRSYAEYGRLSGRGVDDMIAGARVEIAPFKEDPMDFVLWKPSDADLPGWNSPWGRGRPGWHIECSAMADRLLWDAMKDRLSPQALAAPHVIDIHGGGLDLQFPHHENELAQSCCAHHGEGAEAAGFARFWLHNEMLQVEGKKMSKSLGNFFTVRDLLFGEGVPGEVIRYVFLSTHYRKPMDWTHQKAKEAERTLRKWHYVSLASRPSRSIPQEFLDALSDDLNTVHAISILHRYAKDGNGADLLACANLIGLLDPSTSLWFDPDDSGKLDEDLRIFKVTSVRIQARANGRYDISDRLRNNLIEAGVAVFDHKLTSGAFRNPDALKRFAISAASKACQAGNIETAKQKIELLQSAGFAVTLDKEGPSAISGFNEAVHEEHFEKYIELAVSAADVAVEEMAKDA